MDARCSTCGDYVDNSEIMCCSNCGAQMCSNCAGNTGGLCGTCYGSMSYNN